MGTNIFFSLIIFKINRRGGGHDPLLTNWKSVQTKNHPGHFFCMFQLVKHKTNGFFFGGERKEGERTYNPCFLYNSFILSQCTDFFSPVCTPTLWCQCGYDKLASVIHNVDKKENVWCPPTVYIS